MIRKRIELTGRKKRMGLVNMGKERRSSAVNVDYMERWDGRGDYSESGVLQGDLVLWACVYAN